MKIFAFSDLHGNYKILVKLKKKIKKAAPDIVLCAGDFTIFEDSLIDILSQFNKIKRKIFLVHGNHESEKRLREMCKKYRNLYFIHKKGIIEKDVLFLGYGGGGFSYIDKEFEKWAKKIQRKLEKIEKIVLLTHAPVYKTKIDVLFEKEHCGSKSFRKFVAANKNKIKLAVCGHIHETSGVSDKIGDVKILNPGPYGRTVII